MKRNIGKVDQTLRILLGVAIAFAGYYYNTWWGLIGLIPILTSFTGTCPLYLPFGISTIKKNKQI